MECGCLLQATALTRVVVLLVEAEAHGLLAVPLAADAAPVAGADQLVLADVPAARHLHRQR